MQLTEQMLELIREKLEAGMTPEDLANYFGRVNDLDQLDVVQIRSAAYGMEREMATEREEGSQ